MDPVVWLLDVDGVINANRPRWHAAPTTRRVAGGGREWVVRWAPALVQRIRQLVMGGVVDVCWCSTWCGDTGHLESALGLPTLPPAPRAAPSCSQTASQTIYARCVYKQSCATP